jgi:protein phosphatase
VGRVRKVNQDMPLEATNLYAVADGMGGHVGGEVAARVAVETLQLAFTREPTTSGLLEAFSEANLAVWQESQANAELRGMGTTLTAVALVGGADGRDTLALANVGDSRAYVFSDGQIVQVTADHSLAEERMRHGEMTEEEAAVHPQRHILTRALGVSSEVETDMWELHLRSGDRVVLCSDGLSNEIGLDELGRILEAQPDPGQAAHQLVEEANARGGSDNITVVIVDVMVGDEDAETSSVVTPIGTRAGAPLVLAGGVAGAAAALGGGGVDALTGVVPAGPHAAETAATPRADNLAPGAQLGFSGSDTELRDDNPATGEFFPTRSGVVPLARATTRVAPPRPVASAPAEESRGARRRRLGIPRRITLRVILFVLLVAAIPTAAYFAIRWYAYDNWYLALQGNEIVVKQGHPGGILWFQPREEARTGVTTSEILAPGLAEVKAGVQEPSLSDAKTFVANLRSQYEFLHQPPKKPKVGTSTTSTLPGQTTTTVFGQTTTTVFGQTTTSAPTATTAVTTP